jgi:spore coat polysaccharide biosynthesis protein SpsF (cytidylyltransferase family)
MDYKVNRLKPLIIIQARMGSTRLPGKVMRKINGTPLIGYQINRLKESQLEIVVATPDNDLNTELIDYVHSLGIATFRGDELNVLKRFYDAASHYGASDIIRITGDNPLVDGVFIKNELHQLEPESRRFYFAEGLEKSLPLGGSFELFSFELLKEAYENANSPEEFEHVTPYMNQNLPKDIEVIKMNTVYDAHDIRLTVDTNNDFELFKVLIQDFAAHKLNIKEIINLFDLNPHLRDINSNVKQVKVRNLKDV